MTVRLAAAFVAVAAPGVEIAVTAKTAPARDGNVAIAEDHQLITTGPYRYARHPSYTGTLLIFLGFLLVAKLGDFDFRDRPAPERTTSKSTGPTVSMEELGMIGLGLGLGTSIVPAEFTMPTIIYGSKLLGKSGIGDIIMFLLASACDIARLILVMLTLKTMAEAAKAHDAADKCRIGAKTVAIVCGSAIFLTLFIAIIIIEGEMRKSAQHFAGFTFLTIMLSHCLMMILPALGAMQAAGGLGRRKN